MCLAADALRATTSPAVEEPPWLGVLRNRRPPRRTAAATRLVLLGTGGGSYPRATRCGYANAVVVGDAVYLVDCGEGVHQQLWRAGLTVNERFPGRPVVRAVFVTHLHSDHTVDLVNLVQGSWPAHPIDVYGPGPAGSPIPVFPPGAERRVVYPDAPTPGLRAMVDHLQRGFAYNTNVRMADEDRPDVTASVRVREIGVGGRADPADIVLDVPADASSAARAAPPMDPVMIHPEDDHGVRVSAVLVQHAPVFPAFGFRFDTPAGSVVFSGDTGRCENVVRLARGADVLVHEIIDVDRLAPRLAELANHEAVRNHLATAHSTPDDVGAVASEAGVRMLVLSHLVPGDLEPTEEEWESRVRPHFAGEIVCGVDLDEFPLGRDTRAATATAAP